MLLNNSTVYDNLVAKVNDIDTSIFALKTKQDKNKSDSKKLCSL